MNFPVFVRNPLYFIRTKIEICVQIKLSRQNLKTQIFKFLIPVFVLGVFTLLRVTVESKRPENVQSKFVYVNISVILRFTSKTSP